MSSSNLSSTFTSIVNSAITAFANVISGIVNFISQNADLFGIIAGAGLVIGLLATFAGRIPFLGNLLSSLGL